MRNLLHLAFSYRLRALIKKEFNQIRRDRRLQLSLVLPPVLQLTLFVILNLRITKSVNSAKRS